MDQRREPKSPWNPSVSQEEEEAEKELFIEDPSPTVSVLVLLSGTEWRARRLRDVSRELPDV